MRFLKRHLICFLNDITPIFLRAIWYRIFISIKKFNYKEGELFEQSYDFFEISPKVYYYPVPKVATTTIKSFILGNSEYNENEDIHQDPLVNSKRVPYSEIKDAEKIFTVIRDPEKRLISAYHALIKGKNRSFYFLARFGIFYRKMTYQDFLKAIKLIPPSMIDMHIRPYEEIFKKFTFTKVFELEEISKDGKEFSDYIKIDVDMNKSMLKKLKEDVMFGEPRNPVEKEICELEKGIMETRKKISELRTKLPEEEIQNYTLKTLDNQDQNLIDLFGDHEEMLLIHNMGPSCPYCTLWADGFRTMNAYFKTRCAFVLETNIEPSKLKAFKEERGWDFDVVSSIDTTLKTDLGFKTEKMNLPGVSSLFKKEGKVYRHATAPFGPGDDFCHTWHFFDLLKNGTNNWQPVFNK
jgi:predicted dithiol-disulfide oxidoreductase (DUF899 family)